MENLWTTSIYTGIIYLPKEFFENGNAKQQKHIHYTDFYGKLTLIWQGF